MSYQPQYTTQGLAGVIQAISRDATDFKTVVNSVAVFEQRRMVSVAAAVDTETDGNGLGPGYIPLHDPSNAIDANSATAGFFQAAAQAALEGDTTAIDQRNRTIVDSRITSSCFIPGPGDKTSELERAVLAYTQDRSTTLLKSEATETWKVIHRGLRDFVGGGRKGRWVTGGAEWSGSRRLAGSPGG